MYYKENKKSSARNRIRGGFILNIQEDYKRWTLTVSALKSLVKRNKYRRFSGDRMIGITMNHDGAVYSFGRDYGGEGRWICIFGRPKGSIGSTPCNTYVHLELNYELTKIAVEGGLGDYNNFSRYLISEKPVKTTKARKKSKKSRGLFGIGLSLSSIFDTIDTEEAYEIKEYEEIETN